MIQRLVFAVMAARQVEKEYVTDDESSEEEESEGEENSDLSDDSEDSDDDDLLDEVVSELRKKVESSVNLSEKDKSILTFLNQRTEQAEKGSIISKDQKPQAEADKDVKRPRQVTTLELSEHCTRQDAWLAINGAVYNVTDYIDVHPGGWDEIIKGAGIDATSLFNEKHQWVNYHEILEGKLVGKLVDKSDL